MEIDIQKRRNSEEFLPLETRYIGRVHNKNKLISESDFKNIIHLNKFYFQNIFSDYVYEINFPKTSRLQTIDKFSFSSILNFSHIYSITLPPSIQKINDEAFKNCKFLSQITFLKDASGNNYLQYIGNRAFKDTSIESITIPDKIVKIGYECFPESLKSICFENGAPKLKEIGDSVFVKNQLETFSFPTNLAPFLQLQNIFFKCSKLKNIIFDQNANENADFSNDDVKESILQNIKKERLKRIQNLTVSSENNGDCDELHSNVYCLTTNDLAKSFLLSQTKLEKITVYNSNLNYFYFYNTPKLTSITITEGANKRYIKHEGCIYTKDMKRLIVGERNIKSSVINSNCFIIENYALNIPSLEKVVFEKDSKLKEISILAFSNSQIKELNLPDNVDSIDYGAFYQCKKLESINIPKSLILIDHVTFSYSNIAKIKIPKSTVVINYGCFLKCSKLSVVEFEKGSNLMIIDDYAFCGTNIKAISIPQKVARIGNYCFFNCQNLKSIEFAPNSLLNEIGKECFKGTQIDELNLPSSIQKIDLSFTKVKNVLFEAPGSIKCSFGFQETLISSLKIPSSVICIPRYAFYDCANLVEVEILDIANSKLECILKGAFYNCKSLVNFNLPKTVNVFQESCFKNCDKYNAEISVANESNIYIGDNAFENSGIKSFVCQSENIEVQDYAFNNCKNLVTFSAKAIRRCTLGRSALMNCGLLKNVNLFKKTNYINIGIQCFMNSSIEIFDVPKELVEFPNECFKNCQKLTKIIIDDESFIEIFGEDSFKESGIESIFIPSSTSQISKKCFEKCTNLKKLVFSDSIQEITLCEKAFKMSGIEELTISKGIKCIQPHCFEKCSNLRKVVFSQEPGFSRISDSAFKQSGVERICFPQSISVIEKSAFQQCKDLTKVVFLCERVSISPLAFAECDNLKKIRCKSLLEVSLISEFPSRNEFPLKIKRKCINEAIIKALFINTQQVIKNLPCFHFNYYVVDEKYYFDIFNNLTENIQNGYYSQSRKELVFCDFSSNSLTILKETETIKEEALKYSKIRMINFENGSCLKRIEGSALMNLPIQEISIPDSVTFIDDSAFRFCYLLKKININKTSKLKRIGKCAFERTAIESITFPNTLDIIDDYAFYNCFNLETVYNQSNHISFGCYSFGNSSIATIDFPSDSFFSESSFINCKRLKKLNFLSKPKKAVFQCFSFSFSGLEEVNLMNNAIIHENAFSFCMSLRKVTLIENNMIDKNSFTSSSNINCLIFRSEKMYDNFDIYDVINCVTKYPIEECSLSINIDNELNSLYITTLMNRKYYILNETLIYIENTNNYGILCKDILKGFPQEEIKNNEVIIIPSNVKKLSFNTIPHIKKIDWGANCIVEDLGPPGFFSYYNLTEITIPKFVERIESNLFEHCHYLRNVQFEKGTILKEICESSFSNTSIERIELPSTVQIIGYRSFSYNPRLKEVIYEGEIIGEESFYESGLTTFTLSNHTRKICQGAFQYCRSLTSFNIDIIKSELEEIDSYSFSDTSITHINIPPKVKILNKFTFESCKSLKEITISNQSQLEEIAYNSLSGTISLSRINIPKSLYNLFYETFIDEESFYNIYNHRFFIIEGESFDLDTIPRTQFENICLISTSNNDEKFIIDNKYYVVNDTLIYVDAIDNISLFEKMQNPLNQSTFKDNEIIRIPSNVKKLNFNIIPHIKRIDWGANCIVKDLGPPGFFSYYNLTEITIPKFVERIESNLFEHCHYLRNVQFEKGTILKEICASSFSNTSIERIELPSTVQIIGYRSFSYNPRLKEVIYEGEIIGEESFYESGLTTFTLSNRTRKICQGAFQYCRSLTSFNIDIIKSELEEIDSYSFSNTSISHISIPPKVKILNKFTFESCKSLKEITISNQSQLIKIKDYAFAGDLSLIKINIPSTIGYISKNAFINTPKLQSIMNKSSQFYHVMEDKSVYINGQELFFVPRNLKQFHINKNCTSIHSGVFCGSELREVIFSGNSLKRIEVLAFAHSKGLRRIKIPESVDFIGNEAFIDCQSLEIVEFDPSCKLSEIPKRCFAFSGLKSIKIPRSIKIINQSSFQFCQNLTIISLENTNIEYLGDYAFAETSIKEVKLPSTMKYIESHVFDGCKLLKKIDFANLIDSKLMIIKERESDFKRLLKPNLLLPKVSDVNLRVVFRRQFNTTVLDLKKSIKEKLEFVTNQEYDDDFIPFCIIHEFAFCNIPFKVFRYNIEEYKWYKSSNEIIIQSKYKDFVSFKQNYLYGSPIEEKDQITLNPYQKEEKYIRLTNLYYLNCSNLNKVIIGENINLKEIPKFCFARTEIKEISLPSSVLVIKQGAFQSCEYLKKVSFPNNSELMEIQSLAFYECGQLTEFQIPQNVKVIPKKCFSFTGIINIKLPSSIEKICSMAFYKCTNLNRVILNEGITKIGDFAFAKDIELKIISLPDSLTTIEQYAFFDCTNLKQVNTKKNTKLMNICDGSFENTKIEGLRINKNAKTLFIPRKVPNLNKITFCKGSPKHFVQLYDGSIYEPCTLFDEICNSKQNIQQIESEMKQKITNEFLSSSLYSCQPFMDKMLNSFPKNGCFKDAKQALIEINRLKCASQPILHLLFAPKNLQCLIIHENCFSISKSILDDMVNLTTIKYADGSSNYVMNFPSYNHLYSGVKNQIKKIQIIGNYTVMDESCFSYFESLQVVKFNQSTNIWYIPKFAFLGCKSLERIIIPSSCYSIEKGSFKDCISLKFVQFRSNSVMYIKSEAFYNCKSLENITLPSTLYSIGNSAFMNCEKLKKVEFLSSTNEQSLTIIEKNAFKNCSSLLSFSLPSSCIILGPASFMNCTNLQSFIYEGSRLKSIQCRTFLNCRSLKSIKMTHLNYDICEDESIFSIRDEAFMNCSSLEEIIIEDDSKNEALIEFDENGMPLSKLPNHFNQSHDVSKKRQSALLSKRQTIHSRAFKNCNLLSKVRIFLGNLECIREDAFLDCNNLKEIEVNSQYWKKLQNDIFQSKSFNNLEIKLFNHGKLIKIEDFILRQNEEEDINEVKKENDDDEIEQIDNSLIGPDDEKYQVIECKIGEGSTSEVFKVVDSRTGQVMCKKIIDDVDDEFQLKMLQRKLKAIVHVRHSCICKCLGYSIQEQVNEKTTIALFLEFLPFSVKSIIEKKMMSNTLKVKIALEVAFGMARIHSLGMIHGDFKLENIMLNSIFEAKIINIGLVHSNDSLSSQNNLTKVGTLAYMSPEMLNEEDYDNKTDVYSYGIVLFHLFAGFLPKQSLRERMSRATFKYPEASQNMSEYCISLVKQCTETNPSERPTFEEIIEDMSHHSFALASEVDTDAIIARYQVLNYITAKKKIK